MARLYLFRFVGTGTDEDLFRAPTDQRKAIYDLRPDPTRLEGWGLLAVPEAENIPGALDLGDVLDRQLPGGVRKNLGDRLGVDLPTGTLRDVIYWLLTAAPRPWAKIRTSRDGFHRVRLLGETIIERQVEDPRPASTTVSDDFNRPDESLDASGWTEVSGNWSLVSNTAQVSGSARARFDSDLDTVDHAFEAVVTVENNSRHGGVHARYAPSTDTSYSFRGVKGSVTNSWRVVRYLDGNGTEIATETSPNWGGGPDTLRIEVDGSTIVGKLNGVEVISTTDGNIDGVSVGGRRGGLGSNVNGGTQVFDDFFGEDLGAGEPAPAEGSGSASAAPATAAGVGDVPVVGFGVAASKPAAVAGSGNVDVTGSGEAVPAGADVAGGGGVVVSGLGTATAGAASVSGVGGATSTVEGSGSASAGASRVAGAGAVTVTADGSAIASPTGVVGGVDVPITADGSAVSGASFTAGTGGAPAIEGSGDIASAPAFVGGVAVVEVRGDGAAVSQAPVVTGSGATIVVGAGTATAPAVNVAGESTGLVEWTVFEAGSGITVAEGRGGAVVVEHADTRSAAVEGEGQGSTLEGG